MKFLVQSISTYSPLKKLLHRNPKEKILFQKQLISKHIHLQSQARLKLKVSHVIQSLKTLSTFYRIKLPFHRLTHQLSIITFTVETASFFEQLIIENEFDKFIKISFTQGNNWNIFNTTNSELINWRYRHITCKYCGWLLGFSMNTYSYYLLKRIKIREKRCLNVNIISLKDDWLKKISTSIKGWSTTGDWKIRNIKMTKDNLDKFEYKKTEHDVTFIVHKMEGRVFLLGKNGFYNFICSKWKEKINRNVYFILSIKITEEVQKDASFINKMWNDLINKGGQEPLKEYMDTGRIIIINDFDVEADVKENKLLFQEIFESRFKNFEKDKNEKCDEENQVKLSKNKIVIEKSSEYIMNGGNSNIFAKCNMLWTCWELYSLI